MTFLKYPQSVIPYKWLVLLLFLFTSIFVYGQSAAEKDLDKAFSLLQNKEFQQLRLFTSSHPDVVKWMSPFLENSKGNYQLSNELIGKLDLANLKIPEYKNEVYNLRFTNYFHLFQFANAQTAVDECLKLPDLTEKERKDFMNMKSILLAIGNSEEQQCTQQGIQTITGKRDMAGLLRLPLQMGSKDFNFVFDTGANLSVISESNAASAGINIVGDSIDVTGATGAIVKSKIGIAPVLKIGTMEFRNVVFLVFPDDALSLLGGAYSIPGIIGLPVIRQMKYIEISSKDKLTIRITEKKTEEQNLYFDGNVLAIDAVIKDTVHTLLFDMGARRTSLLYRAIPVFEEGALKKDKKVIGGAGGSEKIDVYVIDELIFKIAGANFLFKNASISIEPGKVNELKNYFGTIGSDILKQADAISFDFVNMQFSVIRN